MNEETRNEQTTDPLSRWWRPGQWLRIVYAVWMDQVWYWQNVRPHLHSWKHGWKTIAQSILGTTLFTLVSWTLVVGILKISTGHTHWSILAISTTASLITSVSFGAIGTASKAVVDSVAFGSTTGLLVGVSMTVGILDENAQVNWFVVAVIGLTVGINIGLGNGVLTGVRLGVRESIRAYILTGVLLVGLSLIKGIDSSIIGGIGVAASIPLGGLFGRNWATRQISDEETRRRLANNNP